MPRPDRNEEATEEAAPADEGTPPVLGGWVHIKGGKTVAKHEGWFTDGLTEEEYAAQAAERKGASE